MYFHNIILSLVFQKFYFIRSEINARLLKMYLVNNLFYEIWIKIKIRKFIKLDIINIF